MEFRFVLLLLKILIVLCLLLGLLGMVIGMVLVFDVIVVIGISDV